MSVCIIDTGVKSHEPLRAPTFGEGDANGQGTHVAGTVVAGAAQKRATLNVVIVDTGIGADTFDRGQGTHVAGGYQRK